MVVVDAEVVEVVSADIAGRNVEAADLISGDFRGARGEENALNLLGRFKISVESTLFTSLKVDGFTKEGESGLLGNCLEDGEVLCVENRTHRSVNNRENAEGFVAIGEAAHQSRSGLLPITG